MTSSSTVSVAVAGIVSPAGAHTTLCGPHTTLCPAATPCAVSVTVTSHGGADATAGAAGAAPAPRFAAASGLSSNMLGGASQIVSMIRVQGNGK